MSLPYESVPKRPVGRSSPGAGAPDDLFEKKTIEAGSVYVENLRTAFYANAQDEEDPTAWTVVVTPIVVGRARREKFGLRGPASRYKQNR